MPGAGSDAACSTCRIQMIRRVLVMESTDGNWSGRTGQNIWIAPDVLALVISDGGVLAESLLSRYAFAAPDTFKDLLGILRTHFS